MDTSTINIKSYTPQKKDIDRAENLSWCRGSYYGSGAPFQSEASKMAKLIKDPGKLIRRSIAVLMRWGTRDTLDMTVDSRRQRMLGSRSKSASLTWDSLGSRSLTSLSMLVHLTKLLAPQASLHTMLGEMHKVC